MSPPPAPSRRAWLQLAARQAQAFALATVFGRAATATPSGPVARVPAGLDPFTLGIASGEPRPDSIVLWTRLAPTPQRADGGMPDAPVRVRWQLADDEHFSTGLRGGELWALPAQAHSVHVEVGGLASGRPYCYRFFCGDAVSPVGRTRTAPAADADVTRLRLALASCQHYEQGWFVAHREIARRDVDAVLFVGDYIYEGRNPRHVVRAHETTIPPVSLDAYRRRYAHYKLDADLRAAHAAHPWILTWDDHEVENDYAADASQGATPVAEFRRQRAAAYQAYYEHQPVSPWRLPSGPAMRLYDRYPWGRLAEIWTVDNRQYRDLPACASGGSSHGKPLWRCKELATPGRSMWGAAQEHWLSDGLATSPRQWKLLGQGTQMSGSGIDTPAGRVIYSDGWDGYPRARDRWLGQMASRGVRDLVSLGGDTHRHVAAALRPHPNDPRSPVVASEFVASSVTTSGLSELLTELMWRSNPDIQHARSDERGYAVIDIDPGAARCDFRATPFPALQDAVLHTQAHYTVAAGRAGPQAG